MWILSYEDKVIEKFKTKHEAKESLEQRDNLCYMLKSNTSLYSIRKGKSNASTRVRQKRSMS
jgi:hypothetical protein